MPRRSAAAAAPVPAPILALLLALLVALPAPFAAAQEYRAQTGDVLSIEVLEDPSLNRQVVILPDGRFSFPFAGTLTGAGRTVGQIEAAITTGITSNFASEPTVFVSLQPRERLPVAPTQAATPTIDVYFLGEVNKPGIAPVKPGTTLLQAIAVGGGVTRFAAVKRIQLRRTDPATGRQNVYTLNYKALADGTASNAIVLQDGDVILVPERRLFE